MPERPPGRGRGIAAIGLEVGVQPPDAGLDALFGLALPFREGVQLVHQPFRVNPAQGVTADIELAGIVAEDDRLVAKAALHETTPQRAFAGDARRIGMGRARGDREGFQMGRPRFRVGEMPPLMLMLAARSPAPGAGGRACTPAPPR